MDSKPRALSVRRKLMVLSATFHCTTFFFLKCGGASTWPTSCWAAGVSVHGLRPYRFRAIAVVAPEVLNVDPFTSPTQITCLYASSVLRLVCVILPRRFRVRPHAAPAAGVRLRGGWGKSESRGGAGTIGRLRGLDLRSAEWLACSLWGLQGGRR